jgi:hypothetical protein
VPEILVALARERSGLLAVVSTADEDDEAGPRCAVVQKRIDEIKAEACPRTARVVDAWRSLETGHPRGPHALASAVVVLIETVPFRNDRSCRPADDLVGAVSRTAAWRQLRPAVLMAWDAVAGALHGAGYDAEAVGRLRQSRDPYLAFHHGAPEAPGLAALPQAFRTSILPLLRSRPWRDVRQALSLYWALDLGRDDALRALVVRVLSVVPTHGLGWCRFLPPLAAERRATFLRLLLMSGAGMRSAEAVRPGDVEALAGRSDECHDDRLWCLFEAVRGGIPIAHVLEGFRVADRFAEGYRFSRPWHRRSKAEPSPSDPGRAPEPIASVILPVLEHAMSSAEGAVFGNSAVDIWERCSHARAPRALLTRPSLLEWPADTTLRFLRLFAWDDEPGEVPVVEKAEAVERVLRRVPPSHHPKALDALDTCFHRWRKGKSSEWLPLALALVPRLAHAGTRAHVECGKVVIALVEAAGKRLAPRLLAMPSRSLDRLDRTLERDDSGLLAAGLGALAVRMGSFLIEALGAHPEALFSAARILGSLSRPRRLAVLKRLRAHPVMARRFLLRPLAEVHDEIRALVAPGMPNPVPRRLREHLDGTAALSAPSVERHRQAIARRLLPFRLGLLRRLVIDDLQRTVPGVDPAAMSERHALQMLATVRTNRRILRRVLRIDPFDRRRFLREHPANLRWHRQHPGVNASVWEQGMALAIDVKGHGTLHLAFETEPLEVLRLGTRVGSCLSVGGICDDGAVAVMVDANRRVAFARNHDGVFVARQVITVTADDRLLFFPVYPLGIGSAVRDAFYAYDLALAEALGLRPYRGTDAADYRIEQVIARYSYDDGVWERFAGPADGNG